jgi:hypothetical protein
MCVCVLLLLTISCFAVDRYDIPHPAVCVPSFVNSRVRPPQMGRKVGNNCLRHGPLGCKWVSFVLVDSDNVFALVEVEDRDSLRAKALGVIAV